MFAAIVAAPGCVLVHSQTPVHEQQVSVPHKEPFADLITAPGQRLAVSSSTPAPIEGPLPSSPPAPLTFQPVPSSSATPSIPKPVEDIPPVIQKGSTPVAPVPALPTHEGALPTTNSLYPPSLSNQKPDSAFIAAARAFEDGRADFGQEQLRALPMSNQELLSKLLPAAAKSAAGSLNDPHEVGDILQQLESASDQLRRRADLKIDVLLLASRWIGFGEYTAIPQNVSLRPGQFVLLYSEPKWTVPEVIFKGGQPSYTVCFEVTIRVRSGTAVQFEKKGTFRQETMSQRNNICVPYEFSVPTKPGVYSVDLELTDVYGRRAKRSIDFRVEDRK
ncbi:MAG: hypothetical protein U0798_01020 [Gemmataceae bacterium]